MKISPAPLSTQRQSNIYNFLSQIVYQKTIGIKNTRFTDENTKFTERELEDKTLELHTKETQPI